MRDTLGGVISVRVPATSANLGPGFDALGLALDLQLEVKASLSTEDTFSYTGEGAVAATADNLIHQGFRAAYEEVGQKAPAVSLEVNNPIPLARGLGSSSAALVAGVAAADATMNGALTRDGVFQVCARLEGHPDNVAPAVYGGFTVSALRETGGYLCESLPLPDGWQLLFGVPDFELLTSKARSVLPETYTRPDIIHNLSRAALWSIAVAQDKPDLLRVASQDRLHEPYREPLVPRLASCRKALLEATAYAAYLSGAGPTVGVICSQASKKGCMDALRTFVGAGRIFDVGQSAGYTLNQS